MHFDAANRSIFCNTRYMKKILLLNWIIHSICSFNIDYFIEWAWDEKLKVRSNRSILVEWRSIYCYYYIIKNHLNKKVKCALWSSKCNKGGQEYIYKGDIFYTTGKTIYLHTYNPTCALRWNGGVFDVNMHVYLIFVIRIERRKRMERERAIIIFSHDGLR